MTVAPTDTPAEAVYQTDFFRMYCYKVIPCSKRFSHDWTQCPFSHPQEKARRRDPRTVKYLPVFCPEARQELPCPRGEDCPYCHNLFEYWLHPSRYRTQMCQNGPTCKRKVCFFAHKEDDLRPVTPILHSAPLAAGPAHVAPFGDFGDSGAVNSCMPLQSSCIGIGVPQKSLLWPPLPCQTSLSGQLCPQHQMPDLPCTTEAASPFGGVDMAGAALLSRAMSDALSSQSRAMSDALSSQSRAMSDALGSQSLGGNFGSLGGRYSSNLPPVDPQALMSLLQGLPGNVPSMPNSWPQTMGLTGGPGLFGGFGKVSAPSAAMLPVGHMSGPLDEEVLASLLGQVATSTAINHHYLPNVDHSLTVDSLSRMIQSMCQV